MFKRKGKVQPENEKNILEKTDELESVREENTTEVFSDEDVNEIKIEEMFQKTIDHFVNIEKKSLSSMQRGVITRQQFVDAIYNYLDHFDSLTQEEKDAIVEKIKRFIWGYHILEDVIYDKSISDIRVLDVDNIRIKRYGKREGTNLKFDSPQDLKNFVKYVAVKNHVNISDINAIQTFTDKESNPDYILRFTVTTEFLTSHGLPYMHIRKIAKEKIELEKLLELEMLDEPIMDYLIDRAKNGNGILFTGKGASGKTTLMNALLEKIPYDKSGLIIQENEELFSKKHPELMFKHIVTNRGESKVQYDLQDLARTGLLEDLDYFVIGEIKGGEALYLLNAAYTGHKCWASVHGKNSQEAMNKLADYVKYASDYSKEEALEMLCSIDTIVFMKDFKVNEISEVEGWDQKEQKIIYKKVYELGV